jgi:hypothetical protein
MLYIVLGRVIFVSEVQPAKLSFSNIDTPSGIVTAVRLVQFLNA